MKPNPHPVPSSVRKKFFDNFVRDNTSADLGFTETGSRWDAVRGFFRVFLNRASSGVSAENYPLATVTMPYEDVTISLGDVDNGSSAALWVTGSGDWWAVGLDQEVVDCNCSQGTECDRWNARNCSSWNAQECYSWFCSSYSGSNRGNCASWNARVYRFECTEWSRNQVAFCYRWDSFGRCNAVAWANSTTCNRWALLSVTGGNCSFYPWNANTCTGNSCGAANASTCRSWNSQNCNRWFEFTFDCETCYPQYIRVIQSIGNTVSTVFSKAISKTFRTVSSTYGSLTLFEQDDLNDPLARSMSVKTSGSEISIDVFEDENLVEKINIDETITYTPTGAEITPNYGIMIKPSDYNQQNFIGNIDIDKNF